MAEEKKEIDERILLVLLPIMLLGPIEYDLSLLCDLKVDEIENLLIILELLGSINLQNQINRSY